VFGDEANEHLALVLIQNTFAIDADRLRLAAHAAQRLASKTVRVDSPLRRDFDDESRLMQRGAEAESVPPQILPDASTLGRSAQLNFDRILPHQSKCNFRQKAHPMEIYQPPTIVGIGMLATKIPEATRFIQL
jgi:hypothetical protein